MRASALALALLLPTLAVGATVTPKDPIARRVTAMVEELYRTPQGAQAKRLVPITKLDPSQEIVFTIEFSNTADRMTDRVVITTPIASEVYYKDGSATGLGTEIDFSVDGGRSWGKPEALSVRDADGKARLATGRDYTHIRWRLLAAMAPGQEGAVQFRALLK